LARLLHAADRLSLAWVPADEFEDVVLAIERVGAVYAAFSVEHNGWVVVTTARLRGRNVRDIPREGEHWLQDFWRKYGNELVLCSPGWPQSLAEIEEAVGDRW
jgi:hypothetical protein